MKTRMLEKDFFNYVRIIKNETTYSYDTERIIV